MWASVRLECRGLRLSLSGSGLRLAGTVFAEVWPRLGQGAALRSLLLLLLLLSPEPRARWQQTSTPGAPADQAEPDRAEPGRAGPSQASGQAAVSPGRPQAGGPPTTEAQPRCHGGRSECVHHSGFGGARRVWGPDERKTSRRRGDQTSGKQMRRRPPGDGREAGES